MQVTPLDKRWLQIFRTFIEKALIPQIIRANGSLAEWQIFDSLVNSPSINLNEVQLFVDNLPTPLPLRRDKPKTQTDSSSTNDFNPSKTFGGERGKMLMGEGGNKDRADSLLQSSSVSISGLERLLKTLQTNQIYIENMGKENSLHLYPHPQSFPARNFVSFPKPINGYTFGQAQSQNNRGYDFGGSVARNNHK
jgi:hypothetical protein